jgi:ribosomal-protein-alanine N-acetyltransferase
MLLAQLLENFRENAAVRVELTVRPENVAAIRLYRAFGFRRIRLLPGYYEDGADAVLMRLNAPRRENRIAGPDPPGCL